MVVFIKEILKKVYIMEMECLYGEIIIKIQKEIHLLFLKNIEENLHLGKKKEKEFINLKMVIYSMEIFLIIYLKEKENIKLKIRVLKEFGNVENYLKNLIVMILIFLIWILK